MVDLDPGASEKLTVSWIVIANVLLHDRPYLGIDRTNFSFSS